jgi:hypothetical protein
MTESHAPPADRHAPKIYALHTRIGRIATPFLYGASYSARLIPEAASMDFVYLLFLFVLCAAALGFLLLCDRLGPRQ